MSKTEKEEKEDKQEYSGHVGSLSEEQKNVLEKLKERIGKEESVLISEYTDEYLLRWCRARKFDVEKTFTMFMEDVKWRKEYKLEEKYEKFDWDAYKEALQYFPSFFHGVDKEGRPLYIQYMGDIDAAKLFGVSTHERELETFAIQGERNNRVRYPACSRVKGKCVETTTSIMDLSGTSLGQFWKVRKVLTDMMPISNAHFPETMGMVYIVNAPSIFSMMWNMVKGYMDPVTREKVHVLGGDYKDELLKKIPESSLPERLGGECRCKEECMYSDAGPWQEEGRAGGEI